MHIDYYAYALLVVVIPTNPFSAVVQLFAPKYLPKPKTANLEVVQINLIMWLARPDTLYESPQMIVGTCKLIAEHT